MKKLLPFFLSLMLALLAVSAWAEEQRLTVLFTSDIHSYFSVSDSTIEGVLREHGGASRLQTLLNENRNDHTILVDAGDFAMGTLLQAGYTTDAYELRLMGRLGYDATTFGNHEFDLTCTGAADMLQSALRSGEALPMLLVPANLDLSGMLTAAQQQLKDALDAAGSTTWMLKEVGGVRVAIFGLLGKDGIKCAPTSGLTWQDPITAAKRVVKEIGDQADVIICISHSGTKADGKSGEDIDLIKQVNGIDVVISGHTHTAYHDAVIVKDGTVLGSPGCFLSYLGRMDLTLRADGGVTVDSYQLIPIDENVEKDAETEAVVDSYWQEIDAGYLANTGYTADQVLTHSDFTLDATPVREEMPLGDLIADSYLYACRAAGYGDVEVAVVGCGTIRTSLQAGQIDVADGFEVCSLGAGSDNSIGHPLVSVWITGSDIKLLAEMDAFIGPLYDSVVMNYAGLSVTYDANRLPLDRVTGLNIVHEDGTEEPVVMDQRYRAVANMYAINMLSSIKSMSYGIIDLPLTDQDGNLITSDHLYDYAVRTSDGTEVKEWRAFCDYLASFGEGGIPERYAAGQGRKNITYGTFPGILSNPKGTTLVVLLVGLALILLILVLALTHKRRRLRRMARREARAAKKNRT